MGDFFFSMENIYLLILIVLSFTLQPRHMAVSMDKFKYKLPYQSDSKLICSQPSLLKFYSEYFGGVSAISVKQFRQVNGFSNQYWGWGGEDDNFYIRVKRNNLQLTRYNASLAR